MGNFKRLGEKVRQALKITGGPTRDWKPTSNARNLEMIKEVRRFAQELKALHKDLTALDVQCEGRSQRERKTLACLHELQLCPYGPSPVQSHWARPGSSCLRPYLALMTRHPWARHLWTGRSASLA